MGREKYRYALLDTVRGATLVSMIFYHTTWDFVNLFNKSWPWYQAMGGYLWQQSICWIFIFLSGFCWILGRRPLKHGLMVFAAGAGVSVFTGVFLPQNRIIFGILTLLGTSMLLMIPLAHVLKRLPAASGLACSMMLVVLTHGVSHGYLGIGGWRLVSLPQAFYRSYFTAYLGFPAPDFFSIDYFPLMPWFFLFAAGYFSSRIVFERHWERHLRPGLAALSFFGKHSLLIYMLHQPVIYLMFSAIL